MKIFSSFFLRQKVGQGTVSTATTVAITGCGFKPKLVLLSFGVVAGAVSGASNGIYDGINSFCCFYNPIAPNDSNHFTSLGRAVKDGSNYITCVGTSLDVDGFTFTTTLLGTCSCDFWYIALG